MGFTIAGRIDGIARSVTWNAGELTGDPEAIALAKQHAQHWEGQWWGPLNGPWTQTNHLGTGSSAFLLIEGIFDEVSDVTMYGVPPEALVHLRRGPAKQPDQA